MNKLRIRSNPVHIYFTIKLLNVRTLRIEMLFLYVSKIDTFIEFLKGCNYLLRFVHTECVMDLDYGSEMIIWTTYESSRIFRGSWGSIENWLEPKTEPPLVNLTCLNL